MRSRWRGAQGQASVGAGGGVAESCEDRLHGGDVAPLGAARETDQGLRAGPRSEVRGNRQLIGTL